jgi:hypothetical protein
MELIASLVGTVGVTGALCWYLYQTTAVTIPNLTEKHSQSIDKITERFTDTLKDEREYRRIEIEGMKQFIKQEGCRYQTTYVEFEKPK